MEGYNQQANVGIRETLREENDALTVAGKHINLRQLVKNFRGYAFELVIINTHNSNNLRVSVNSRNADRTESRADMAGPAGKGMELTPYGTITLKLTAFQVARHQVDFMAIDPITKLAAEGNYSLTAVELQATPEKQEP